LYFPNVNFCAILADSAGAIKSQAKMSFRSHLSGLTNGKPRPGFEEIGFVF